MITLQSKVILHSQESIFQHALLVQSTLITKMNNSFRRWIFQLHQSQKQWNYLLQ